MHSKIVIDDYSLDIRLIRLNKIYLETALGDKGPQLAPNGQISTSILC